MKRLRSAEDGRERLDGRAYDVVVRLLRREGAARGLRMEAQGPRTRALGAVARGHGFVPDAPCRAVFGDFFEEIIVRIEKERKLWHELIHVHSAPHSPFHVLHTVAQGERQFLDGGRTCFANVVAAYGNGVEFGSVLD